MKFIRVNEDSAVSYINYMPFDEKHGLGKTREELEKEGVLVGSIPEPEQIKGKSHVLYCNPATKKLWYEYDDIPKTEEEIKQDEIIVLKQQIEQQNKAIADLTMLIASTQTPTV